MSTLKPKAWRMIAGLAAVALTAGAHEAAAQKPAPAANTLTAAERAEGWKLLFNGKDLAGWRGYRKTDVPAKWQAQDGTLTLTGGDAGDLITKAEFGDFDLQLEWKISPGGNSGVIYFVKEGADLPQTYNTGPEMQILDDERHADGKTPSHRSGALYDIVVPPSGVTHPVGEWNQARIIVRKGHIEHWLNGVKTAESSYGDDAWRARVAASKFKSMPQFGKAASGHIALQDHGNLVWYRNIKIRAL